MTKENLENYIELTKDKIYENLILSTTKQSKAFVEGFKKVIDPKYLKKFSC